MIDDYKHHTLEEAIHKTLTCTLVGAWVYPKHQVLGGSAHDIWQVDLLIDDDFEYMVFTINFYFGQTTVLIEWLEKTKIDDSRYVVIVLNADVGVDIKSCISVLHRIEDITGKPIDDKLWDLIGGC